MTDLPEQGSRVHVDFGDCVKAGTLSCAAPSTMWGTICEVELDSGKSVIVQPELISEELQEEQAEKSLRDRAYDAWLRYKASHCFPPMTHEEENQVYSRYMSDWMATAEMPLGSNVMRAWRTHVREVEGWDWDMGEYEERREQFINGEKTDEKS